MSNHAIKTGLATQNPGWIVAGERSNSISSPLYKTDKHLKTRRRTLSAKSQHFSRKGIREGERRSSKDEQTGKIKKRWN